jgi:DNA adenine methylase
MITKQAKPFLKWAGGKTQLLGDIEKVLPKHVISQPFTFVEPFVGSGAVLFWMLNNFPNIRHAVINDINEELINTYKIICRKPQELISILKELESIYHTFEKSSDRRKEYFYEQRAVFNSRKSDKTTQAALFIFLNRTCFNGLYRVNRNNDFNVPLGSYIKPTICDTENLLAVSEVLQKVEILSGDYQQTLNHVTKPSLFYFDPPYKPLSETSSFNSYAKDDFNDEEQIRLRDFCKTLDIAGHNWILSNSDVRGKNEDTFFDDLYNEFNISRVLARRSINVNAEKRGKLTELLITNFETNALYV